MKSPSYSWLCAVLFLVAGVLMAWATAAPDPDASWTVGGCDECTNAPQTTCPDADDESNCTSVAYRCDTSGDLTCTHKATHSDCMSPGNGCVKWWHESCD